MQTGRASRTALRVAHRRAAHQVLDNPCILHDPIAVPLLGPEFAVDHERESHPIAKAFRAFIAARSRFGEDELAAAAEKGVSQYVVLGAGLDTFAYRNTNRNLCVFEVDFPATQEWKRILLDSAGIALPSNLAFVPLDFERKTLMEGLSEAGIEHACAHCLRMAGVVPYLSLQAFRSTIKTIATMPKPTAATFDFAVAPELLGPRARAAFDALSARVAAVGEPFQLFFTPEELEAELRRVGFSQVEFTLSDDLNARYFTNRTDGLNLPVPGLGMMATARV